MKVTKLPHVCTRPVRIPTVRDPPVSPIMAIHQPELCPDDPDSPGSSCQSHHGNTPARTVSGRSRQSGILLSVSSWQYTSQNCVRRIPTVRDPPVNPIMAIHQPQLCPDDPDSPGSSCQSHHGNTPARTVSGGSRQSGILLSVPSWQYTSQNCVRTIPTVRDPPVNPIMAIHQPQLCPDDPDSPGSSCQSHHGNTPARTVSGRSRQSGILLSVSSWQYTSQNCVRTIPTVRDPPVSLIMAIHQPELCPEDPDSPGSSCQSHHGNTPATTVSGRSRQSGILLSVSSWQYTSQNCVRRIPTVRDPPVSPIMAIHQPELCPDDPDSPGSSCQSHHGNTPATTVSGRSRQSGILLSIPS